MSAAQTLKADRPQRGRYLAQDMRAPGVNSARCAAGDHRWETETSRIDRCGRCGKRWLLGRTED